jgi:anti-sigma factor RsiW
VNCSSCEDRFEEYLDGTLAPALRVRLRAHLARCGSCQGVLEELRVVDALLVSPRTVELPENFTFATMAEVRALPRPHVSSAPVVAYFVSYLVAAWLLIGAGFLLSGRTMRVFGETALDLAGSLTRSLGAVAHAGGRMLGDFGGIGTLLGTALVLDLAVVAVLVFGFAVVRPRIAERLRG